jgi:hypothetical protein
MGNLISYTSFNKKYLIFYELETSFESMGNRNHHDIDDLTISSDFSVRR